MRRKCPICGRFIKSKPSHQPVIEWAESIPFPLGKKLCSAPVAVASSNPLATCSKGHIVELPFQDC